MAGEADYGHAHPQRIQAGGVAIVGKRVEGDIHSMIPLEVLVAGPGRDKLHAIAFDTSLHEDFERVPAVAAFGAEEE